MDKRIHGQTDRANYKATLPPKKMSALLLSLNTKHIYTLPYHEAAA